MNEDLIREIELLKEEMRELLKDPKFIEECEEFCRKIHSITPEEMMRVFDI
jgi:hypothetical protein